MDRPVVGCLGVRAQGVVAVSARNTTRRRAVRRSGSKPFQVPYFELKFLTPFKQNCTKV
jgi:hypothetical protein